jgi:hypothetical protein
VDTCGYGLVVALYHIYLFFIRRVF